MRKAVFLGILYCMVSCAATLFAQTPAESSLEITNQTNGKSKYIVKGESNVKLAVKGRKKWVAGKVNDVMADRIVVGMDTIQLEEIKGIQGAQGKKKVLNYKEGKEIVISWFILALIGLATTLFFLASSNLSMTVFGFGILILLGTYTSTLVGLPYVIIQLIRRMAKLHFPEPWTFKSTKS